MTQIRVIIDHGNDHRPPIHARHARTHDLSIADLTVPHNLPKPPAAELRSSGAAAGIQWAWLKAGWPPESACISGAFRRPGSAIQAAPGTRSAEISIP